MMPDMMMYEKGHVDIVRTFQHQQQVVTAVERAKQVTMSELNSIIGVILLHLLLHLLLILLKISLLISTSR